MQVPLGKGGVRKLERPQLHLVFGGRVKDPRGVEFIDADNLHVVGIYPSYAEARKAWEGVSRKYIDYADIKYVILNLNSLLEPDANKGVTR